MTDLSFDNPMTDVVRRLTDVGVSDSEPAEKPWARGDVYRGIEGGPARDCYRGRRDLHRMDQLWECLHHAIGGLRKEGKR